MKLLTIQEGTHSTFRHAIKTNKNGNKIAPTESSVEGALFYLLGPRSRVHLTFVFFGFELQHGGKNLLKVSYWVFFSKCQ